MSTLTHNEAVVLGIVRQQARQGDPVAAGTIKSKAQPQNVAYDQVDRALRGLIALGKVTRPSRGYYLPTESNA